MPRRAVTVAVARTMTTTVVDGGGGDRRVAGLAGAPLTRCWFDHSPVTCCPLGPDKASRLLVGYLLLFRFCLKPNREGAPYGVTI